MSNTTHTVSCTVTAAKTALSMGSGSLEVFATPAMSALMEKAAAELLQQQLPDGDTSVGTQIEIWHNAASPVGATVTATAELLSFDGKKATFTLRAQDEFGPIGEGSHTRAVITASRFMDRLAQKKPEQK
ncbi:Uncharacterised protein [Anaerotruncus sp. 2789STDY5834896]|uniref:Fluoroacetyl-CoA-specific thioesterase-like domain-containing protein n=1 Tax=uncultured Anaerotruncus sp. TaxID=905011 RepID=A0A1C6HYC7_9FIRM|nr:Uncharacterised protein [uncultured Anaerotruncus sp.]